MERYRYGTPHRSTYLRVRPQGGPCCVIETMYSGFGCDFGKVSIPVPDPDHTIRTGTIASTFFLNKNFVQNQTFFVFRHSIVAQKVVLIFDFLTFLTVVFSFYVGSKSGTGSEIGTGMHSRYGSAN
jgi:hypothetical protein